MFAGLSNLAQALQGGPDEDQEEYEGEESVDEGGAEDKVEQEEAGDSGGAAGESRPAMSFWGVASVLTASVKAKTAEVLTAVQETDWRAELEAFQQGAKEDAEAVGKGADAALHKAVAAAEHLPGALEQLPGNAGAALPVLQARAEAAAGMAKAQAGRGLANLAGLGSKIVLGTHDLFEQISHAVQNEMALAEAGGSGARRTSSSKSLGGGGTGGASGRYSRFDADVAAMQRDSSTYCDEPEDEEDFGAWLAGFDLAGRRPDIDRLIAENTFMSELQARIVPLIVEYDAFWTRYFYRLHKLEQKHQQFVQLTQRVAQQQEEEVGWSDEEEEQQEQGQAQQQTAAAAAPKAPAPATAASVQAAAAEQAAPAAAAEEEEEEAAVATSSPTAAAAASPVTPEDVSLEAPATVPVVGAEQDVAAAAHPGPSSPSDISPATTALSSEGSLASGEHWQVVSSPRQQAAAAGGEAQPAPAAAGQPEEAAAAMTAKPASSKGAAVAAAPAPAAAADEEPVAAAAMAAEGGDDDLSDWGEEDEAALEAATAAAGGGEGGEGDEDGALSDWE